MSACHSLFDAAISRQAAAAEHYCSGPSILCLQVHCNTGASVKPGGSSGKLASCHCDHIMMALLIMVRPDPQGTGCTLGLTLGLCACTYRCMTIPRSDGKTEEASVEGYANRHGTASDVSDAARQGLGSCCCSRCCSVSRIAALAAFLHGSW